jgi:hypothetical protein
MGDLTTNRTLDPALFEEQRGALIFKKPEGCFLKFPNLELCSFAIFYIFITSNKCLRIAYSGDIEGGN